MHHQFSVEHVQLLIGKCVKNHNKNERSHRNGTFTPVRHTKAVDARSGRSVGRFDKIGQLLTVLRQFKKLVHSEIWHKLGINYVE
jgi:hypothetical protein